MDEREREESTTIRKRGRTQAGDESSQVTPQFFVFLCVLLLFACKKKRLPSHFKLERTQHVERAHM